MTAHAHDVTLRTATLEDSGAVAEIWHLGWQDGHLGHVPQELLEARTEASFRTRASERVDDTTVAVVGGAVAGFVMVVGDEVEQVYVSAGHRGTGVAGALIGEAEKLVRRAGTTRPGSPSWPATRELEPFYERSGWQDEGPFDYVTTAEDRAITVPCHRYTKLLRLSRLSRAASGADREVGERIVEVGMALDRVAVAFEHDAFGRELAPRARRRSRRRPGWWLPENDELRERSGGERVERDLCLPRSALDLSACAPCCELRRER